MKNFLFFFKFYSKSLKLVSRLKTLKIHADTLKAYSSRKLFNKLSRIKNLNLKDLLKNFKKIWQSFKPSHNPQHFLNSKFLFWALKDLRRSQNSFFIPNMVSNASPVNFSMKKLFMFLIFPLQYIFRVPITFHPFHFSFYWRCTFCSSRVFFSLVKLELWCFKIFICLCIINQRMEMNTKACFTFFGSYSEKKTHKKCWIQLGNVHKKNSEQCSLLAFWSQKLFCFLFCRIPQIGFQALPRMLKCIRTHN